MPIRPFERSDLDEQAACAMTDLASSDCLIELVVKGANSVAQAVLGTLPEWFGRPAALDAYVTAASRFPTLVARSADGRAVGFVTLERHTPVAAEVHVMGVVRTEHGRGYGRRLLAEAERHLAAAGVRWLTVKTLAASHPDPYYAKTRAFYEAVGFEPLEVFLTLWGDDTPCLLMMKPLLVTRPA